jgi:predicted DNA-binding transcriptional regulator AlpA
MKRIRLGSGNKQPIERIRLSREDRIHLSPRKAEPPHPCRIIRKTRAAKLAGVVYTTWWRWSKEGRCPPEFRIGGVAGYLQSDLMDWIRAHQRP